MSDETLIALQEIYTYIRSRDLVSIYSSSTLNDFIEKAKTSIDTDGKRPSKRTRLDQLEKKIDSVIERAKNN